MKHFRAPLVAVPIGIVIGLAGCGSSSSSASKTPSSAPTTSAPAATTGAPSASPTTAATTSAATITIKGFSFGTPLTVKAGQKISVVNKDTAPHTVTADDGKSFDAAEKASGGTATFSAPSTPGKYAYHCSVHPNMHGTLIVS